MHVSPSPPQPPSLPFSLLDISASLPSEDYSSGIDLIFENYASASPNDANRGDCASDYAAGHYHTKLVWSKLMWSDYSQLRVDVTDMTYASSDRGAPCARCLVAYPSGPQPAAAQRGRLSHITSPAWLSPGVRAREATPARPPRA